MLNENTGCNYVCLARYDMDEGMAVTVFENTDRDTFHVGLLDTESGEYVAGSVRIFPASMEGRRAAVNAYADSLIDKRTPCKGLNGKCANSGQFDGLCWFCHVGRQPTP